MTLSGAGSANEVTTSDSDHQLTSGFVHSNHIVARYTL